MPAPLEDGRFSLANKVTRSSRCINVLSEEGYLGEQEPFVPVDTHIPGARNFLTTCLLGQDGRFLSPQAMSEPIASVAFTSSDAVIVRCGSGVTACHAWLVLHHIGHTQDQLQPGS